MRYGEELIKDLEREIETTRAAIHNRLDRINEGLTFEEECFVSQRCDERAIRVAEDKIKLIRDGGTRWFIEYATLDGQIIPARWCNTKYGTSLRAEMPDGSVVWTTATTQKGLARKGLKKVRVRRPAWFRFASSGRGMLGVYTGSYVEFPSDWNYATGEEAPIEPLEIEEITE